jgi:hypothetical protein
VLISPILLLLLLLWLLCLDHAWKHAKLAPLPPGVKRGTLLTTTQLLLLPPLHWWQAS